MSVIKGGLAVNTKELIKEQKVLDTTINRIKDQTYFITELLEKKKENMKTGNTATGEIKCSLYLNDQGAALFDIHSVQQFTKNIQMNFNEMISPLNPDFIKIKSSDINELKEMKLTFKESVDRLEGFREEINFINTANIDFIEWENIEVPPEKAKESLFMFITPKKHEK